VPLTVVETDSLKIATGRSAAQHLLTGPEFIDGIICASDTLAVGAIGAATDLGIQVPDDLAVIGYDDNHFAAESLIPVSTTAQPGYKMGELATELLLREIAGGQHEHRNAVLDPCLIIRRSSQRLRPSRGEARPTQPR
jgi:LacI family transcriptional regulator